MGLTGIIVWRKTNRSKRRVVEEAKKVQVRPSPTGRTLRKNSLLETDKDDSLSPETKPTLLQNVNKESPKIKVDEKSVQSNYDVDKVVEIISEGDA